MDARALYHSIGSAEDFWRGVDFVGRFAMGDSPVHRALEKLASTLDEANIPYAIAGAMALGQHGYVRATTDVDVLLTRAGLAELKSRVLGRGYVEKFPGSKGLRDTENNITIDVLIAGDYPGDGRPKEISFPDPATIAVATAGMRFLPLGTLLELKLASGMSALHRAKDIGDVVELIRAAKLPRELGAQLRQSVRAKYEELWDAAASAPPDE